MSWLFTTFFVYICISMMKQSLEGTLMRAEILNAFYFMMSAFGFLITVDEIFSVGV